MEKQATFRSGPYELEGLADVRIKQRGVVVTHPHPLYGGDMYNNVVQVIVESYAKAEFTTVRFNFRGVGRSQGAHDHGIGEQEDVRSVVKHLREEGATEIHLAGYSFGAWVNAQVLPGLVDVHTAVMISPPVNVMSFHSPSADSRIRLVVTGERDDIAGAEDVGRLVGVWNPDAAFYVIPGADHFYGGREGDLRSLVEGFLEGEVG
ncbi:MAG: alpha/beta fold hydrolase [Desulfobacteraceae bacterium]|jgi:alpha/beta superfamily hydrolase